MKEEELYELQRYYELGLIDERFLSEDIIRELKKIYREKIQEKKENLKMYKEEIAKYLNKF